ncbi:MAG: hypothetical protein ACT4RN_18050 [Pseudonocardia sp.]
MDPEPRPWTLPAPIRALVWWPPIALLLATVAPAAAPWAIALAGAVLTLLGVLGGVVARRAEPAAAVAAITPVVPAAADADEARAA